MTLNGDSHQKNKCGKYDRATVETFLGVSFAYIRSLEGSKRLVEVLYDVM